MLVRMAIQVLLLALFGSLAAQRAEAYVCFAGPNCPLMYCEYCTYHGGEGWCCDYDAVPGKCLCIEQAPRPCHMTGTCSYATCLIADGSGPCIWNESTSTAFRRRTATLRGRPGPGPKRIG